MKEKISIRNICKLLEIQVVAHLRNAWLIIKSYYIDVNPFPQPSLILAYHFLMEHLALVPRVFSYY